MNGKFIHKLVQVIKEDRYYPERYFCSCGEQFTSLLKLQEHIKEGNKD